MKRKGEKGEKIEEQRRKERPRPRHGLAWSGQQRKADEALA